MKIVFMGSPDFAVPSLKKLHATEHTIESVVTNVDKRRGRGSQKTPTQVKEAALSLQIPVIEVENLKSEEFANQLRALKPDLLVVVAFRILPKSILEIPTVGSINLHASLLPKYRGAAPIHWAIINGEEKTGCTIFFLDEKVDTGNILLQKEVEIGWEDNTGDIYHQLMEIGSDTLVEAVNMIANGDYDLKTQDDSKATPAPKLFRENSRIDFNKSADEIHNLIRGLSPFPTAWTTLNDAKMNIYQAKPGPHANIDIGELIVKNDKLLVGCADGTVELLEIQLPGKKRMQVSDFLQGNTISGKLV